MTSFISSAGGRCRVLPHFWTVLARVTLVESQLSITAGTGSDYSKGSAATGAGVGKSALLLSRT